MSYFLSPVFNAYQILDNNGNVVVGAKLHTYLAGTTTNSTTWQDNTGSTENTNPIISDSAGRFPTIQISTAVVYDFVLTDASDVMLLTVNDISVTSSAYADSAGTADTLTNPRLINLTSFNGSADIITAGTTINAQTNTTYTLALSDAGQLITFSNANPITVTIPLNADVAFVVGTQLEVLQVGAGKVTFIGDSGVTTLSLVGNLSLAGQYAGATLIKQDTDTWYVIGNLVA